MQLGSLPAAAASPFNLHNKGAKRLKATSYCFLTASGPGVSERGCAQSSTGAGTLLFSRHHRLNINKAILYQANPM
jgi:hypothetical protein